MSHAHIECLIDLGVWTQILDMTMVWCLNTNILVYLRVDVCELLVEVVEVLDELYIIEIVIVILA